MIKSIGSLHNVPGPSSLVLSESLKLLTTFGDKKAISAILEQLRDIQAHNEKVFKDTQAAIEALSVESKAFEESRKAFAAQKAEQDDISNQRTIALSQAEARLSGKASALANEQAVFKLSLDKKETALANREQTCRSREMKCDENERGLASRMEVMGNRESDIVRREKQLQVKENKMRAAMADD